MGLINESTLPLMRTILADRLDWGRIIQNDRNSIETLLNEYGNDIIYRSDEYGMYAIHWAAINGEPKVFEQLIKAGASPTMKANIPDAPQPIHFAALEGNIEIIDLLLSLGVDINVVDNSGITPISRAAMFGSNRINRSAETVLHLISRGSDVSKADSQGLNCMHYAVLQKNEETVRLLLNIGLDPNVKDKKGFKPFDYAVKTGNSNLIKLLGLLTDGLSEKQLKLFLKKHRKQTFREITDELITVLARVFVLMAVFSAIFWAYPQYFFYYLPQSLYLFPIHICFFASNIILWFSWYKTCTYNPGYLAMNTAEYERIIESKVTSNFDQKFGSTKTDQYFDGKLCHYCKTVQRDRSKHCRLCKRCTARFDHHCIYLSICIGHNNRLSFFCFIFSMLITGLLGCIIITTIGNMDNTLFTAYNSYNLSYCVNLVMTGGLLTFCTLRRAAINLTQDEEVKCWRNQFIKPNNKVFKNPFDKGNYWKNLVDFFKVKPYSQIRFDY